MKALPLAYALAVLLLASCGTDDGTRPGSPSMFDAQNTKKNCNCNKKYATTVRLDDDNKMRYFVHVDPNGDSIGVYSHYNGGVSTINLTQERLVTRQLRGM